MTLQRVPLVMTIAFAIALGCGALTPASTPKPVLLPMLVGSWNCTYSGPKGRATAIWTFTRANDLWLTYTRKSSGYGEPAHQHVGLFGYDTTREQYVDMNGSTIPGELAVTTAKAARTATGMTFVIAYPADPTHDTQAFKFRSTAITSTETWIENGKTITGHFNCIKRAA